MFNAALASLPIVARGVYHAAPVFQVSVSWIRKALKRRRDSERTTARPQVNRVRSQAAGAARGDLGEAVTGPDLTLAELRVWLQDEHQVSVSLGGPSTTLASRLRHQLCSVRVSR